MLDKLPPYDRGPCLQFDPEVFLKAIAGFDVETVGKIPTIICWFAELTLPMPRVNGFECWWYAS